ncbi:hypothetical protein EW093_01005 [Thiospirochaeta perfilievii]|uniref:Beta-Casp domain-containing protein n=1 Tax=Thiospirochaeta perfilievii TaxID=252967 RepID=A0A5C1Q7D7_9SPIO|nr:MBL fold metallo-hydrolase RNA specificity domain-containing protein [Thiospirochaeta perfilievii]QEN03341.1 hypothetical protein EW093_01005 [Thiospirochaeta perfilievii]
MHRAQEILFDLFYLLNFKEYYFKVSEDEVRTFINNDNFPKYLIDLLEEKDQSFKLINGEYYSYVRDYDDSQIIIELLSEIVIPIKLQVFITSPLIEKLIPIYKKGLLEYKFKNNSKKYLYGNDSIFSTLDFEGFDSYDDLIENIFTVGEVLESNKSYKKKTNKVKKKHLEIKDHIIRVTNGGISYTNNPCHKTIVLGSSGMCNDGAIVDILNKNLTREDSTVLITGYQAKDTNGYYLSNLDTYENDMKHNTRFNNMDCRLSDVKSKIINMSAYYSGHADKDALLDFIYNNPKEPRKEEIQVFLNHGDNDSRKELAHLIDEKNCTFNPDASKTIIPMKNDSKKWYNLSDRKWEDFVENQSLIIMEDAIDANMHINWESKTISFPVGTDTTYIEIILALVM